MASEHHPVAILERFLGASVDQPGGDVGASFICLEVDREAIQALVREVPDLGAYAYQNPNKPDCYILSRKVLYAGSGATFLLACYLSFWYAADMPVPLSKSGCLSGNFKRAFVALVAAYMGVQASFAPTGGYVVPGRYLG